MGLVDWRLLGLKKVLPGHPGQVDFTARQETLDRMSSIHENNNSYLNCGCRWKCGFISQLVEHCTSIRRGHGLESCWSPDFFRLLSNCFNWKIYCDDHSSLSSTTAVQMLIISYNYSCTVYFTSFHFSWKDMNSINWLCSQCVAS